MDFMKKLYILIGCTAAAIIATIVIGLSIPVEVEHKSEWYLTHEDMAKRTIRIYPSEQREAIIEEPEEAAELVEEETYKAIEAIPLPDDTQEVFEKACEENKVNYAFALAMMESESTFNPGAVGDSGSSVGYMQIKEVNWDRMNDDYDLNVFVPHDNIKAGVIMMHELIDKYGDLDMVVMCYKGGEGAANRWKEEGFRLSACDEIVDRTMYWQSVLDAEGR